MSYTPKENEKSHYCPPVNNNRIKCPYGHHCPYHIKCGINCPCPCPYVIKCPYRHHNNYPYPYSGDNSGDNPPYSNNSPPYSNNSPPYSPPYSGNNSVYGSRSSSPKKK
jgi:hypothetical protein